MRPLQALYRRIHGFWPSGGTAWFVTTALVVAACGSEAETTTSLDVTTTTEIATTTTQPVTTTILVGPLADWDLNPATLASPVEVLESFEFEFVFMDDVRQEPYSIITQGVFVEPDTLSCTVTNPAMVDAFGNVTPLGTITASGETLWWDDGVFEPDESDRDDEVFVEALQLCPGAFEFWRSLAFLQIIGLTSLDPPKPPTCVEPSTLPGGMCPLEFEIVGAGGAIEGFSTTLVEVKPTNEVLEAVEASLWVTDEGWPIRFLFKANGPGKPSGKVDGPFTLGDDPDLDELWLDCENGKLAACDDLVDESPFFSAYESFGWSCGLRFEPSKGTLCQDNSPVQQDQPYTLGDDPRLDGLWRSCADGNDDDCDELFDTSAVGSAYEIFGETCGMELDTDLAPCDHVRLGLPIPTGVEVQMVLTRINDPELTVRTPGEN